MLRNLLLKQEQCRFCDKVYTHYRLIAHLKADHGEAGAEASMKMAARARVVSCSVESCSYEGVSEAALKQQLYREHATSATSDSLPWSCPICQCGVANQVALNEHCRTVHGKEKCSQETKEFATKAEYEVWKTEMERQHVMKWRIMGTTAEKEHTLKHYVCHRSGVRRCTSKGVRAPKKYKIVTPHCTAFLKAKLMLNGTVMVRYCVEHIGHIVTAPSLPLSDGDRETIGHYLQLGLNIC
ncbi:hypothetical protein Aduo_001691 [Ancylostoma duodenale]